MRSWMNGKCGTMAILIFLCLTILNSQAQVLRDAGQIPRTAAREDWDTLQVPAHASFGHPFPPMKGELADFTREFVQLDYRPSDLVELYIMKPRGVEKPPVILYLYTYPSQTDRFRDDTFGKIATENGFAAVGFVSALTGYRFHDRPQRTWFISQLQESLGDSVHDVQIILNYLESRGDLDMSRVGMYGTGSGASIAIMAASVDPRIKALELFDPWGDWPQWLAGSKLVPADERKDYLKPEFLKTVENLEPVKWLPELKTQKVRLDFMNVDPITPPAARELMQMVAPKNADIVTYQSPEDFLQKVALKGTTFNWLKEQLDPKVSANHIQDEKLKGSPPESSR